MPWLSRLERVTEPSRCSFLGVGLRLTVWSEELFEQWKTEGIRLLAQARDLAASTFKNNQDVVNLRREAIKVSLKISPKLLLAGAGLQVVQCERVDVL